VQVLDKFEVAPNSKFGFAPFRDQLPVLALCPPAAAAPRHCVAPWRPVTYMYVHRARRAHAYAIAPAIGFEFPCERESAASKLSDGNGQRRRRRALSTAPCTAFVSDACDARGLRTSASSDYACGLTATLCPGDQRAATTFPNLVATAARDRPIPGHEQARFATSSPSSSPSATTSWEEASVVTQVAIPFC